MRVGFRLWFLALMVIELYGSMGTSMHPTTYLLERDTILRDGPKGRLVDVWPKGMKFTAFKKKKEWVKVSGTIPEGKGWRKYTYTAWVHTRDTKVVGRQPHVRKNGTERYIVIDKSNFTLSVLERRGDREKRLFSTKVATGIDRCLPKEEGGKCYYTEAGVYHVRWKIFDPEGIEWCIPKSMEKEVKYREDIASGKRCFRGALGKYALNIGKTYAIHGTKNEGSLGTKASHGCIRAKNSAMETLYGLMREGDSVYIRE